MIPYDWNDVESFARKSSDHISKIKGYYNDLHPLVQNIKNTNMPVPSFVVDLGLEGIGFFWAIDNSAYGKKTGAHIKVFHEKHEVELLPAPASGLYEWDFSKTNITPEKEEILHEWARSASLLINQPIEKIKGYSAQLFFGDHRVDLKEAMVHPSKVNTSNQIKADNIWWATKELALEALEKTILEKYKEANLVCKKNKKLLKLIQAAYKNLKQ